MNRPRVGFVFRTIVFCNNSTYFKHVTEFFRSSDAAGPEEGKVSKHVTFGIILPMHIIFLFIYFLIKC